MFGINPLQTLLEQGLLSEIQEFLTSETHLIKLNAVWALKNLLHEAAVNEKRSVLKEIGWESLQESVCS